MNSRLEAILEISEEVARGLPVSVQFTLANRTDEELLVLDWFTPLEGVAGDIFRVERDGEPVAYRGILVKRGIPHPDEYVSIAPGESVSAEVDLAESYDLSAPGSYTIEFLSPAVSHVVSKEAPKAKRLRELAPEEIPSRPVTVRIVDSGEGAEEPVPPPLSADDSAAAEEAKKISYDDCTTSQQDTVKSADVAATFKSPVVYHYYEQLSVANRQTDALYKKWFGAYDEDRYAKVLSNWQKIQNCFLNGDITYNCQGPLCQPSYIAYVFAVPPLEVFLCQQFWNMPEEGTDTKYGTLIHEFSHECAGTKDHTYGYTNCQNLATNDPDKAIENADNYQFFAEEYTKCPGSPHMKLTLLAVAGGLAAGVIGSYLKSRSLRSKHTNPE
jgi:peptidyl-Lys metalloendopeptidase